MFEIHVKFLEQQIPKGAYSKMSIDEIYDYLSWDACLTITHNNQNLFLEEVPIIEFYWYLVNWYSRCLVGNKDQFVYSTIEHIEPILVFSPQQNHYWEIDSIWKQCDKAALIEEETLYFEVHKLLKRIKGEIEKPGDGSVSSNDDQQK